MNRKAGTSSEEGRKVKIGVKYSSQYIIQANPSSIVKTPKPNNVFLPLGVDMP
jgi:hypothetical protein